MELRIRFSSEIYIEGKSIDDIRNKWEGIPLFSNEALECGAEFINLDSAERTDDNSYKDVTDRFKIKLIKKNDD